MLKRNSILLEVLAKILAAGFLAIFLLHKVRRSPETRYGFQDRVRNAAKKALKNSPSIFASASLVLLLAITSHVFGIAPLITTFDHGVICTFANDDEVFYAEFPFGNYTEYSVEGLGVFLLDDLDDRIKNKLRQGEWWEKHIAEILMCAVRPGTIALDLGAHIGTHTITLSKSVGSSGQVIAFEPQRKIFFELVANLAKNNCYNVTAYRCALGDDAGTVEMARSPYGNEGATRVGSGGDEAPIYTLDTFDLENISVIKIDCENYEDKVLKGAAETIKKNKPVIIIEIMGNREDVSVDLKNPRKKVIKQIKKMGYSVKRILRDDYICYPSTS